MRDTDRPATFAHRVRKIYDIATICIVIRNLHVSRHSQSCKIPSISAINDSESTEGKSSFLPGVGFVTPQTYVVICYAFWGRWFLLFAISLCIFVLLFDVDWVMWSLLRVFYYSRICFGKLWWYFLMNVENKLFANRKCIISRNGYIEFRTKPNSDILEIIHFVILLLQCYSFFFIKLNSFVHETRPNKFYKSKKQWNSVQSFFFGTKILSDS